MYLGPLCTYRIRETDTDFRVEASSLEGGLSWREVHRFGSEQEAERYCEQIIRLQLLLLAESIHAGEGLTEAV